MKLFPCNFSCRCCCCLCAQGGRERANRKTCEALFWIWVKADKVSSLFAYIWLDYGIFFAAPFTRFQLPAPPTLTQQHTSSHLALMSEKCAAGWNGWDTTTSDSINVHIIWKMENCRKWLNDGLNGVTLKCVWRNALRRWWCEVRVLFLFGTNPKGNFLIMTKLLLMNFKTSHPTDIIEERFNFNFFPHSDAKVLTCFQLKTVLHTLRRFVVVGASAAGKSEAFNFFIKNLFAFFLSNF